MPDWYRSIEASNRTAAPRVRKANWKRSLTELCTAVMIDEAGKVALASMVAPRSDPELLQAAKDWKFIPAFLDGKPVAYRLKMDVQLVRGCAESAGGMARAIGMGRIPLATMRTFPTTPLRAPGPESPDWLI
jgi:hypothetical protein